MFDWDDLWVGGLWPQPPALPRRAAWVPRIVSLLEHRLPAWVHATTTCSQFLADRATAFGAPATAVLHNGFWPRTDLPSQASARARLGLDPKACYAGFMGRPMSELDWCLDTLDTATSQTKPVRLALCGVNPEHLAALPAHQRQRIDDLGLLPPDRVPDFARALDWGLLPLEDTPFNQSRLPIKFAEYLGAGTPVIASAVGELTALAQRVPGVHLAGTTRDAWRQTLASTLASPAPDPFPTHPGSPLAQVLGWPALAQQLAGFYARLLDPRPAPSAAR